MKHALGKVATIAASAMLLMSLAGCGSSTAATVNGDTISEKEVTEYIEALRGSYGLDNDYDWYTYMNSYGYDAESMRSDVINMFAQKKLIEQAASDAGLSVDDSTLDSAIDSIKSNFDSDEAFQEALSQYGYTEEEYRSEYKFYLLEQLVSENLVETPTPTDEEIQTEIDSDASNYAGKKSSQILVADEATAQALIDRINAGEDFATLASENSTDTTSASDGGNVGWDCLQSFVDEYQTALDGLAKGEMTQSPVKSSYGYHIILCTDVFEPVSGESIAAADVPTEIYNQIVSDLKSSLSQSAFYDYCDDLLASADVEIKAMPSGLSYDVTSDEAEAAKADSTTASSSSSSSSSTSSSSSSSSGQ